jgi:KaiC/GvpD/RAD55 family RecA-like ATPase
MTADSDGKIIRPVLAVMGDVLKSLQNPPDPIEYAVRGLSEYFSVFPGEFTVLAGRGGSGKSCLGLQLATNASLYVNSLYMSLEMDDDELILSAISQVADINTDTLLYPKTQEEEDACYDAFVKFEEFAKSSKLKFGFGSWDIDGILESAKDIEAKLVVIDYLQLVKAQLQENRSSTDVFGDTLEKVKRFASREKVAIVGINCLTKETQQKKPDNEPTKEAPAPGFQDFYGGSKIEFWPHNVFSLWQPGQDDNVRKIRCLKARRQGNIKYKEFKLRFDGARKRFI